MFNSFYDVVKKKKLKLSNYMSREITMKLNQILYQRSKNWRDSRPNTGILRSLDRKSYRGENRETFDKYLKDHINSYRGGCCRNASF